MFNFRVTNLPGADFYRLNLRVIAYFSAIVLILLMAARIVNLLVFGNLNDIYLNLDLVPALLLRGLRFDLKLVAVLLLVIVWIPGLIPGRVMPASVSSPAIRYGLLTCLLLIVFIVFIDIGYLSYYGVPIDVLVFGLFDDDTEAVFKTILTNYRLMAIFAALLFVVYFITRLYISRTRQSLAGSSFTLEQKLGIRLLSGLLLLVLARGSLDTFPLQRKLASVGDNPYINLLVMNSSFNLYYAWRDKQSNKAGIFKRDILKMHKLDSYQELLSRAGYSEINKLLKNGDNSKLSSNPLHVVFILMEGWSSQIAMAHGEENQVLGTLAPHVKQDYFNPYFFANTFATNSAIESLLLNSPITPLSQSVARNTSFRLSNAIPFKDNGYATAFISGGYASWRNHASFWLRQGFDQYFGRSEIETAYQVEARDHPWGVYDEYLFEKLKEYLVENERNASPSFSFIMTTTNHSPMRLPDSYTRPPLQPQRYGLDPDRDISFQLLTGFHYSSEVLGNFMTWLKSSDMADRVMVVATGDHSMRTLAKTNGLSGQFFRYSVPVYIYTPAHMRQLADVPRDIVASHSDLFPTIFKMILPGGEYFSFGDPLMIKDKDQAFGWSNRGYFLFNQGVADANSGKLYPWRDADRILVSDSPEPMSELQREMVQREQFRDILKTYLLVQDFKDPGRKESR